MIKRSASILLFSTALLLGQGAAGAAEDCGQSPNLCDDVGVLPSAPATDVPTAAPAAPVAVSPKQTLPVTGSETAALAAGGLLLVAAGGALVWRSNRAAA